MLTTEKIQSADHKIIRAYRQSVGYPEQATAYQDEAEQVRNNAHVEVGTV